ncbi:hypothetical protein GCM10010124_02180 [Pilimelia terevasa]|uniref:Uncharacterized protein n=1 Tax=Pilimelia terevasa TaxID=53372 RepID=A0A8J3BGF7_9ACTN|nr:hypothetical protein GCM10010124_02180 [Pilimelia terevasa]
MPAEGTRRTPSRRVSRPSLKNPAPHDETDEFLEARIDVVEYARRRLNATEGAEKGSESAQRLARS